MGVRKVSNSKRDLQGHWQWCHSTTHIQFPITAATLPYHGHMLDILYPVTATEVTRVLSSSSAKSSTMDIIPTSLLICCKVDLSEIIVHLANLSFVEGRFPTLFKQTSVTPVIKGQSLHKSVPSNYRPISNLNFISKILERLFLSGSSFILTSSNFNKYQSAYQLSCLIISTAQLTQAS